MVELGGDDPARVPKRRGTRYAWPEERPAFQLTERAFELLYLVHRYRFARSSQLSRLLNASHKKLSGRLTLLFRAQYLVRPTAQITYFVAGGGTDPIAVGLANEGARVLREIGLSIPRLDWTEKNGSVRAEFLAHALGVTDFRIALQLAAKGRPGVTLLEEPELLPQLPRSPSESDPFTFRADVRRSDGAKPLAVRPDTLALLLLPDGTRRGFFVEIDRGTMPVSRAALDTSSILRKLVTYDAVHEQGLHLERLGWRTFRVLLVTSSAERMRNMQRLAATEPLTHRHLFLFAEGSCAASPDLLGHAFVDCRGQPTTLVPFP